MRLSRRGAKLIEGFEGFRGCPYRDAVGVWTIGYGSTKGVGPGTKCISRKQAEERLIREVSAEYGPAVARFDWLNQSQYDALVSFVYNVGPGALGPGTGIGAALRRRDPGAVADELLKWDKAGGRTLPGLTRRRREERRLFLSEPSGTRYTAPERRWITEYDRLRRQGRDKPRRRVLRRVMTRQRKAIWRAAQKSGWEKADRRARYKSLLARTT